MKKTSWFRLLPPYILIISLLCGLLSACGFHLRNKNALPKTLHQVAFSPVKPYSKLTTLLTEMLTSMGVKLLPASSKTTRFALLITKDDFTHARAQSVNANLPTSATYAQTATLEIKNIKTNAIVASNTFSSSESQTLNTNQLYTPATNRVAISSLNEKIVVQIFYWLSSAPTKALLIHATQPKRT